MVSADRVMETTTTTGTGALALAGAVAGFRTFDSAVGVGNTCRYTIEAVDSDGIPTGDWEVGTGTLTGATTLARTAVFSSSNGGSAVNLAAGTKRVYVVVPAEDVAGYLSDPTAFDPAGSAAAAQAASQPLDGDLTSLAAASATGAIYYRSAANTWSPVTIGSALSFAGGTLSVPNLSGTNTGDQTITLTGDVTGSGTGSFATAIGAGKVTNSMLAGGIAAAKLVGTDIATVGTVTSGVWNGTAIAVANGGTGGATAAAARTNLGLVIGTDVQAWDADLDALAALAGTNTIYYRSAANTWSPVTIGSGLSFAGGTLIATGGGGGDLLSTLTASEVAVSGATTATVSRMHHVSDSGTPADYTITLPAASGNAGKLIGVRIDSAATKLFTLDAGSGVGIGPDPSGTLPRTRIMHNGESAILLCDGTNWHKVAGVTIPILFRATRSTDYTIAGGAWEKVPMTALDTSYACPAAMWDSANGVAVVQRPGKYRVQTMGYCNGVGSFTYMSHMQNGANPVQGQQYPQISSTTYGSSQFDDNLAVGDVIGWALFAPNAVTAAGSVVVMFLHIAEVPTW